MAGAKIALSGAAAELQNDGSNNAMTNVPGYSLAGAVIGGGPEQGPAVFSEVDAGTKNGVREVLSPEVDKDYRLRVAHDNLMDIEEFVDTAQNTGKFTHNFITLTATISSAGLLTNSGNITTTTTGMSFNSKTYVPVGGTQTYVCETSLAFTAQPNANTVIDFGGFLQGAANPFLPLDGAFFRLTSAGLFGVVSRAGVETPTSVFPLSGGTGTFVYTNNANNRYLIQMNNVSTSFWINNYKYAEIAAPVGGGFPCQSRSLAWGIRHAIVGGTAGAATQALVTGYRVLIRGVEFADDLGVVMNRAIGSYQGLSGGTMGQLIAGTVTTGTLVKPTAAVPLNASLAANLPNSLGGRIYEALTAGLAVNVDGIFASFTVPAASVTVQARRLKVTGILLSGFVSTVVVGGPVNTEWYLAFGHTADSMATTDGASFSNATTKAPRRVMLPSFTQVVTAAQAVQTLISQPGGTSIDFPAPIYVNPGERIALVGNRTASVVATAGVLSYTYQFIYSWE